MNRNLLPAEQFALFKDILRRTLLILPVSVSIGSFVALFLWLLHQAVQYRFAHTWLLYLLPLAGLLIHFIYQSAGKSSEKGNNLIIDEIHTPGTGIPAQMGPVVLITTIITHLFGGSAGREGTAVQIGGSVAEMFSKWFKLDAKDRKMLLTAGVAAGFGAVFGTPLTGAVFAIEVLTIGRIQYTALIPCLIASALADITVSAWNMQHTSYHIEVSAAHTYAMFPYLKFDLLLLFKVVMASCLFGLLSLLFSSLVHSVKNLFTRYIPVMWLIPVTGGIIIIALTLALGKPDYLGLGTEAQYTGAVTISSAFNNGGAQPFSWFWKTIYTAITLSSGFKGGEVTPLFYIGATLGNTLAILLHAPVSLFAALGFIAVFAGATNTPLACTIMGVELFGADYALFFAAACFTSYLFSGHKGIYPAQRIIAPKFLYALFSRKPKRGIT